MPKDKVLQKQKQAEVQRMPEQQFLEGQEQSIFLQDFMEDEQQLAFEKELQEQKDFLMTSKDVENLRKLNTYMEDRSHQAWAQNYDEFSQLAGHLNQQFQSQYHYETKNSNWAELEQQAHDALAQVMARDAEQQKIKENTSFAGIEETIDAILKDRNIFTDSKMFRGIRETCEKYKAEKKSLKNRLAILAELQGKVRTYTEIRYKKDGYGSKKGSRRMGWMSKLLAMIGSVQESSMPEVAEYAEQMTKNDARRGSVQDDLFKYHRDKVDALKKTGNTIPIERYGDFLLYYERDKKGNVTEETRQNYEQNMKMLDTLGNGEFTPENQERRIGALVKIYHRLKKMSVEAKDLTPEGAMKKTKEWLEKTLKTEGFTTVYNNFDDLLKDERNRYQKHNVPVDPRITYMKEQTSNNLKAYFVALTEGLLTGFGLRTNGELNTTLGNKKIKFLEKNVKDQMEAFAGMAREEYEKGTRIPDPDPELEASLKDTVAYYDDPEGYMQALAEETAQSRRQYGKSLKFVSNDLKDKYGDYFSSAGLKKLGLPEYWLRATTPERIWSALDPYEKDENGNVTEATMANYKQNERIMELLYSPDAEDRIAVIAKMYLKLGKLYQEGTPLTEKNILKAYKKMSTTDTIDTARNILDDMVESELKRDADNELVKYMNKFSKSKVDTNVQYAGEYILGAHGYRPEGNLEKLPGFKEVQRGLAEEFMEELPEEIEKEKKENDGHILREDPAMEERLKDLCRRKGLRWD